MVVEYRGGFWEVRNSENWAHKVLDDDNKLLYVQPKCEGTIKEDIDGNLFVTLNICKFCFNVLKISGFPEFYK